MAFESNFVSLEDPRWDELVADSMNGCFLHSGRFLGYHGQRFVEKALLLHDAGGSPVAGVRFVVDGTVARSHPGSTYGGMIFRRGLGASEVVSTTERLLESLHEAGFLTLECRPLPPGLREVEDESDLYAIHRLGGEVVRRDLSTVCTLSHGPALSTNRVRRVAKAQRFKVRVVPEPDVDSFHQILVENLSRHRTSPVHSASEIRSLMRLFPERIRLHCAELDGEIIAGVMVFDLGDAIHAQYLASSEEGRRVGALDLLVHELIAGNYAGRRLLSLGISTEKGGRILNEGLVRFKESFGGYSQIIDTYEIPT